MKLYSLNEGFEGICGFCLSEVKKTNEEFFDKALLLGTNYTFEVTDFTGLPDLEEVLNSISCVYKDNEYLFIVRFNINILNHSYFDILADDYNRYADYKRDNIRILGYQLDFDNLEALSGVPVGIDILFMFYEYKTSVCRINGLSNDKLKQLLKVVDTKNIPIQSVSIRYEDYKDSLALFESATQLLPCVSYRGNSVDEVLDIIKSSRDRDIAVVLRNKTKGHLLYLLLEVVFGYQMEYDSKVVLIHPADRSLMDSKQLNECASKKNMYVCVSYLSYKHTLQDLLLRK